MTQPSGRFAGHSYFSPMGNTSPYQFRLTVATWSGTTTWSFAAGSSQASSTPASELCRSATAEKKPTIRSIIARGIFG